MYPLGYRKRERNGNLKFDNTLQFGVENFAVIYRNYLPEIMMPLQPVLSIRVDAHYFGELRLSLVQPDGYHDFKTESHIRMYKMSCWVLTDFNLCLCAVTLNCAMFEHTSE